MYSTGVLAAFVVNTAKISNDSRIQLVVHRRLTPRIPSAAQSGGTAEGLYHGSADLKSSGP